jgi:hypothetical protein
MFSPVRVTVPATLLVAAALLPAVGSAGNAEATALGLGRPGQGVGFPGSMIQPIGTGSPF